MNAFVDGKQLLSNVSPPWLSGVDQIRRDEFLEQQRRLAASEESLRQVLGYFGSLEDYARHHANRILQLAFAQVPDADRIVCRSRYEFRVGGRTAVQEDSRSLTEQMICGLHEEGRRARFTFEGDELPAGLDQAWFEQNMPDDVPAGFGIDVRKHYQRQDVMAALEGVLRNRLLLSALAARYQGHLSEDRYVDLIQRAVTGDDTLRVAGLRLRGDTRPLLQMLLIGSRDAGQPEVLLYAPGSPGGQDWYECQSHWRASVRVGEWTEKQSGRDYLIWNAHAMDRQTISSYLNGVEKMPTTWKGVDIVATPYTGTEALYGIVQNTRAWRMAEEENRTPYGYVTAPLEQRQQFARIRCELKALQVIAMREGGFTTYEAFCFNLIKERVEQVLAEKDEYVDVNPDRITVSIDPQTQMSLTELISSETHFYAQDKGSPWSYPRFTLEHDHPAVQHLDIRHIASWSRTLRPGEKYIDLLKADHLDETNADAAFKRLAHLECQRRQMQAAVMQERFKGRLSRTRFRQLMEVVDALETVDTRPVNPMGEYPGQVRHSALYKLHLEGKLVVGVYVFRLVGEGEVEEFLYTPDAPDGRVIRPHREFVEAVRTFGMGDYFYRRVRYKDQPVVGTYITDMEDLSRIAQEPALQRNSRIKDLGSGYDDLIRRTISDVDEKTRSLDEIIFDLVFNAVEAAATAISVLLPPVGIAMSVVLLGKNILEGMEAYNDGDRAGARDSFLKALVELASLGYGGYKHLQPSKLQMDVLGLLGNTYSAEKFLAQASGLPRLHSRALEKIQEILDDPQSMTSRTSLR